MKTSRTLATLFCGLLLPTAAALGQPPSTTQDLVGTWLLVRVDNVMPDGTRVALYGPDPQGQLIFDSQGHYALQMVRGQRKPFAAGDKAKGTADEYRAAALDGNAHYGQYAVDPAAGAIRFHIVHATYPNWDGNDQVRPYHLQGDELTYVVPTPTSGTGATGEVVWRRVH